MTTLSERKELLDLVGWREKVGSRLVSRSTSAALESELQTAIVTAQASSLANERDLVWLLGFADDGDTSVPARAASLAADDRFLVRLLRSALGDRSGFGMGDVAQKHEYTMAWEYLCELLGDELLVRRLDELNVQRATLSLVERDEVALDTAMRYRRGWRPGRFMSDEDEEDEDNDAPSTPSTEARAEERKYGANILLHLLASVVPARRRVARDRIAHMADNKVKVPDKAIERLVEVAADESMDSGERTVTMDLIRRLEADEKLVTPLMRQWFTSTTMTGEI